MNETKEKVPTLNPADFFSGKPIEKVVLHQPSRRQNAPSDMSALDSQISCSLMSLMTLPSGTDYVDEYVKAENEKLYELSKMASRANHNFLDNVSLATGTVAESLTQEGVDRLAQSYSFSSQSKSKLTISTVKEQILNMVDTNPTVIIQGPTGCGKTTQVPQYILENSFEKKVGCNIVVTQPRRIAAISIAKRVCEERNWQLGSLVGYKVGLSNCTSADTRLTYCTTGVLLHRLVKEKNMNDFTHIIIDEVHERDQDMDFLLLIVRKLLRSNSRSVKVILMSATINVDKFSKYFSIYVGKNLTNAPIVDVVKNNYYDVRDFYLSDIHGIGEQPYISPDEPTVSSKMYGYCKKLIIMLDQVDNPATMETDDIGDRPTVLVFLPGIYEIEEMHRAMAETSYDSWDIVILHSLITNDEQARIFGKPPKGCRRVILSTNIAESSLTVPNVKYVVDFCLTKQLVTDPQTNFQCLEMTWASKANCQQRAGRTGRVMDGRVYRLVPKNFYEQVLPEENPPEILRAPLTNVFLKTKLLDMDKPQALLALSLDPPDLTNLVRSVLTLKETGALQNIDDDPCDGELTDLGRIMAELPVDIHISKLIVLGQVFSVLSEAIIMGAGMAVKNMFSTRYQRKLQAYNAKLFWAQNSSSDGIAFNNAYRVWRMKKANLRIKSSSEEIAWARRNYLEIRVLREVDALIQELTKRLEGLGITETVGSNKVIWTGDRKQFVLKLIIAGAFYPQYYVTSPKNDEKDNNRSIGGLDPTKTVYFTGWPREQPGMLYAKRFQQAFSQCANLLTDKIGVKFSHSNRVFIQFGETVHKEGASEDNEMKNQVSGEIPMAIYQAIKMRSVNKEVVIPVLDIASANSLADELKIDKEPPTIYLPKENMSVKKSALTETRPMLPSLDISHIPLLMRNIVNPGHFWVSINDSETLSFYNIIKRSIKNIISNPSAVFDTQPSIGSLVLAPFEADNEKIVYNRAIIQYVSVKASQNYIVGIFFIDFGTNKTVSLSDIRKLPADHEIKKIPALAFQCILTNVRPPTVSSLCGEWPTLSKKVFHKVLSDQNELYGEVYSVVNGVVSINLLTVNNRKEKINVNQYLIKGGYAEFREESFLSKENHELRVHHTRLSQTEKFNHEEMQHNQLYLTDTYVEPPEEKNCPRTVKLNGPFSTLEVKLGDLTNVGIGMKVNVHDSSVNSVLLDAAIEDTQPKLLVAGNVSQAAVSNRLTLRNTTLMPNIPGLTSLIALFFSPQIDLRCNALRTRNTGVLCGLGFDPQTGSSLFPEHDMYIDFDVDIVIDDLQSINQLRYWMSMGIFISHDSDDDIKRKNDTLTIQNKVKDLLVNIIDKPRVPVQRHLDLRYYQWCRYNPSMYMQSKQLQKFKLVFGLHRALMLGPQEPAREMMISHLEELKKLAGESTATNRTSEIECKLCSEKVYGILGLRSHLFSSEHRHQVGLSKLIKD